MPDLVRSAGKAPTTTVLTTLQLLDPLADELYAITGLFPAEAVRGQKTRLINIGMKPLDDSESPTAVRIPTFLLIQLKIAYNLAKIARKVDVVVLGAGAATLFLPAIVAKMLGKKLISLRPGTDSIQQLARVTYDRTLFGLGKYAILPIIGCIERLGYSLSDRIIVFRADFTSPTLRRYARKVCPGVSRFFVDSEVFKVERKQDEREYAFGYIARLVEAGGILNLVKAMPLVLKQYPDIKVMIGGDGALRGEVEREIQAANLADTVTMTGWISQSEVPHYLNRVRLLVIPSYIEAGPHMLFEAMACGTPVVGAPVGVIPDVIRDGENGFLMENNTPECIAQNIIRALNHPDLGAVADNARKLVEREYAYPAAVEKYRRVLASLE